MGAVMRKTNRAIDVRRDSIEGGEECLRDKPRRGRRAQVKPLAEPVKNAEELAAEELVFKNETQMMGGVARGIDGPDAGAECQPVPGGNLRFGYRFYLPIDFGHTAQGFYRTLPKPGRIDQVGNRLFMTDDLRLRKPFRQVPDAAGMVHVDMG